MAAAGVGDRNVGVRILPQDLLNSAAIGLTAHGGAGIDEAAGEISNALLLWIIIMLRRMHINSGALKTRNGPVADGVFAGCKTHEISQQSRI